LRKHSEAPVRPGGLCTAAGSKMLSRLLKFFQCFWMSSQKQSCEMKSCMKRLHWAHAMRCRTFKLLTAKTQSTSRKCLSFSWSVILGTLIERNHWRGSKAKPHETSSLPTPGQIGLIGDWCPCKSSMNEVQNLQKPFGQNAVDFTEVSVLLLKYHFEVSH